MSLNYDMSKVAEYEEILDKEFTLCRDFIFYTMSTGINEITEDNYADVFARIKTLETKYGKSLMTDEGDSIYTLDTVRRFIGLWTNASRLTAKEWVKYHDLTDAQVESYRIFKYATTLINA